MNRARRSGGKAVDFHRQLTLHLREGVTRLGEKSVALFFGVEPSSADQSLMELQAKLAQILLKMNVACPFVCVFLWIRRLSIVRPKFTGGK